MNLERARAIVRGAVQGVGFRPFVYRLATTLGLKGWVVNSTSGVIIEAEGSRAVLNEFLLRLENEKPPRAIIQSFEFSFLELSGYAGFEIRHSDDQGEKCAFILPDIAPCKDCAREIFTHDNRRYLYPFTNCTNCGPRFSIIEELPYDRPNTSMKKFAMCADCLKEYEDPADRRFHAQPNACPKCGPKLALWDVRGQVLSERHEALLGAAAAVRNGMILALKAVGGFQLIVDARNEEAVRRLRQRKHREDKPLAVMYPAMFPLREDCLVDRVELRLLSSAEAPIVLLQKSPPFRLAEAVAPRNSYLGTMLPSSPLHHILLRELGFPVVTTSGNVSNEPICIDENDALKQLREIADVFLVHDRLIVRPVDDSVLRIICGREMMLRRARGYAPLPIHVRYPLPSVLAVGSHLKNTVALGKGEEIFVSQHVGDLSTLEAMDVSQRIATDLQRLYDFVPETVACDLHPEYQSTRYAHTLGKPIIAVQHHFAHILACMAENDLDGPVLGVAWDGTGYGTDETIWGGEFLKVKAMDQMMEGGAPFERVAHIRHFGLPGGDAAVKEPRRTALGLLWEVLGEKLFAPSNRSLIQSFSPVESSTIHQMLTCGINTPLTSSVGRLFDAVAAIIGLRSHCSFEGHAAMELEFVIQPGVEDNYSFEITEGEPSLINWQPMLNEILADLRLRIPTGNISAKFHNTLVEIIVEIAIRSEHERIVLSGGCFQNKYLLERAIAKLREVRFKPYWHQRIPTNDGGIALGQVIGALRQRPAPSQRNLTTRKLTSTDALPMSLEPAIL